jgi:hypothetical protein
MTGPGAFAGSERARQLLTALQERAYASAGRAPNVYDGPFGARAAAQMVATHFGDRTPEEQRRIRDQITRTAAESVRQAPSRYEDPLMYSILVELASSIETAAAQTGMTVPHRPVLGSLPHGQVNALTILVPGTSEHIVLFESQMFLFASLLSKAVARAFPLTSRDGEWLSFSAQQADIERRIDSDPSVLRRFTEVVLAYAMTGRPGDAPQYVEDSPHGLIAGHLREALELFVLGHEYGHVIGGHLTTATRTAALLPGEDTEALDYSWRQEHEADVYGAMLAVSAMMRVKRLDGALSYWGSDLFFSAMDVMDRAVSLLRTGDERRQTLGSHPPADQRRAYLRRSMRQVLGDEAGGRLVGMGELVERVVAALWTRTRPAVLDARARGGEAARTWRT